jgi:uncharacterized protein with FMN-binding domain
MTDRTSAETPRALWRTILTAMIAVLTAMALTIGVSGVAHAEPKEKTPTASARKAATPSALSGVVTGTLQDGSGAVDGIINIEKFTKKKGQLVAVGKFIGTVTDANGKVVSGSKRIALPVATAPVGGAAQKNAPNALAAAPGALSCQVLDLVLGPLDLNLLGLVVHLDTVKLNITAEGGPGNLLGNLLCAVAGLLDGTTGLNGILNKLVGLLNQLLGVLG